METAPLLSALRGAISDALKGVSNSAVAYSGGLDSSLLAKLAAQVSSVRCYTAATKGSYDERNARACAEEDGLDLEVLIISPEEVGDLVKRASELLGTADPLRVSYTIPVLRVLTECDEGVLLVGSGADELFGGYAKYTKMEDPEPSMRADLLKMKREGALLESAARSLGKEISFPFADERVLEVASKLTCEEKIFHGERKVALRALAKQLGLGAHGRPKKAAQYSSGVMRAMQDSAKKEGVSLPEWTAKISGASSQQPRGLKSS